jgi:hypothetical protein
MALKYYVELVDDLDGGEADQTVGFRFDGIAYEIDLSDAHADELRATLAPFVAAAHRVGGAHDRRPASKVREKLRAPADDLSPVDARVSTNTGAPRPSEVALASGTDPVAEVTAEYDPRQQQGFDGYAISGQAGPEAGSSVPLPADLEACVR